MKVSIKEIMCDVKTINDIVYISDVDLNRIINQKKRTQRGKVVSKEKLADMNNIIKINGVMFMPLTIDIDDCYHNNFLVK